MATRHVEVLGGAGADAEVSRGRVHGVPLRRFPYPYRALLAICSDLDETPDRQVYFETSRFLNTTENTSMGPGVGLEVGNTIYFDMPADQFSYWNTDDSGRAMVRALIQSGHIDCLHSYGDFAHSRSHAARARDELGRNHCRLEVWIDHAIAPTNFGGDIMQGSGDVPGAAAYHADLSCDSGIQYVWRGRVTSVIGQDAPRSLSGIFHVRHPFASVKTAAKEWVKGVVAERDTKYAMHGRNHLLREIELRSGHNVHEFMRCNPHWGGVSRGETGAGLPEVLTHRMLRTLLERQGVCVLYTHLGKITNRQQPLGPQSQSALRLLAEYANQGDVLVTTTRRLLGYCRAMRSIAVTGIMRDGVLSVDLAAASLGSEPGVRRSDLDGLTVYVPAGVRTRLTVNGGEVDHIHNDVDDTGRPSISLPWKKLAFPSL
ncbi:MAG: hypothetical protein LAN64_07080 [Acidobacteriia bacterium]|nr:hypothetical protein [Terriglobia bacterium]